MEDGWTPVLLPPVLLVLAAGGVYVYGLIAGLLSRTCVRNKVVVITDALSGLGTECSSVFHRGGARLILCGRSLEELQELADDLAAASDPAATFPPKLVRLDAGDVDGVAAAAAEVLRCYGCLDTVVFNGSAKLRAPAPGLSLEDDRLLMNHNYHGPAALARGLLPSMISRRSGHLLLVSSIQGQLAVPFRTSYAASKHAVQAFFDSLRAEVEQYGVSVSTVQHTFISPAPTQPFSQKPLGVTPDEVTAAILRTLSSRRREVVLAPALARAAVLLRSCFPNVFFAVMAAGVNNAAAAAEFQEL